MRTLLIALCLGLAAAGDAAAGVSVGIQLPGVSIGINVPVYPRLVAVPGYPVYYAPGVDGNFFFYDGLYWVYDDDRWYASSWYNGPWRFVEPGFVPLYVLRVPVLYYRRPPPFFGGWRRESPPRWGAHWGREWEDQHHGWDHWNRAAVPPRAPLPSYQRQYSGERYPHGDEQRAVRDRMYGYQPRDRAVRAQYHGDAGPAGATRPAADDRHRHDAPSTTSRGDRPATAERPRGVPEQPHRAASEQAAPPRREPGRPTPTRCAARAACGARSRA